MVTDIAYVVPRVGFGYLEIMGVDWLLCKGGIYIDLVATVAGEQSFF